MNCRASLLETYSCLRGSIIQWNRLQLSRYRGKRNLRGISEIVGFEFGPQRIKVCRVSISKASGVAGFFDQQVVRVPAFVGAMKQRWNQGHVGGFETGR